MREAVIVSGIRTAVGKANKGSLKDVSPVTYGAEVIKACLAKAPQLAWEEIDDLIVGCSFPEGEKGMNFARILGLRAGLPHTVPAITVNRFCASGLQTVAMAAERIILGNADVILAGGLESMTLVPIGGNKIAPDPDLVDNHPEIYLNMGITAENVAQEYDICREEQDKFAVTSHLRAGQAIKDGKFKEEILPINVSQTVFDNGKIKTKTLLFDQDEGVRPDTTLAALAKLKPAFKNNGTVTAGNSSQTSDCAAMTLVMSLEKANQLGVKPWGIFRSFAVSGVRPEVMGIGPVVAIPKALKMAGLDLKDIALIELNEAFAAQALAVIKELKLDMDKVNVNGGAIALGHPLGCTGTKLTISLLKEMERRKARYGMVSMCIGGGMGVAGIFERFDGRIN
jgi:acetyl-CoA acyltransferase